MLYQQTLLGTPRHPNGVVRKGRAEADPAGNAGLENLPYWGVALNVGFGIPPPPPPRQEPSAEAAARDQPREKRAGAKPPSRARLISRARRNVTGRLRKKRSIHTVRPCPAYGQGH